MTPDRVEQVFLESKSGSVEALLVLEDAAGARYRERIPLGTPDYREATARLARHLAGRGIESAGKLRLRVTRGGDMNDDAELLELFRSQLES